MNMDLIKAIFYAGLPVQVFTFLMVYYAYNKGYLTSDITIRDAFKDKKNPERKLSKANKKACCFSTLNGWLLVVAFMAWSHY